MSNYLWYGLTFLAGLVIGLGWMLVHFCLTIGRALDNFFNLKERK